MRVFGLIGYPLSHSFSKSYFKNKFINEKIADCEYRLFPISAISEITTLVEENPDLVGFNVTIPYKCNIIPYLNFVDPTAATVGAVNTVKVIRNNLGFELHGYNTDIIGFELSLKTFLSEPKKALILGTGGAAKAVAFVMGKLHFDYQFISRLETDYTIDYSQIDKSLVENCSLIINTTPLGMYPNILDSPAFPYSFLGPKHVLYDLIYNPEITEFLKQGKNQGTKIKNGLEMLHIQAEEAWKIWNI